MNDWPRIYAEIESLTESVNVRPLFFRGHRDAAWTLLPTFGRIDWLHDLYGRQAEHNLYYEFLTRAGDLIPDSNDSWAIAFAMQHHGMPTRLLDWSDTLSVALHFALGTRHDEERDAAIWILNPFALNKATRDLHGVFHPTDLDASYHDLFVSRQTQLTGGVAAIWPLRHHPRVFSQHAGFTVHGDLTHPLEQLYPNVLKKIVIPPTARSGARRFLELAGVSEFALFPDLDGLARDVLSRDFQGRRARSS
jgi:hypothetical protein